MSKPYSKKIQVYEVILLFIVVGFFVAMGLTYSQNRRAAPKLALSVGR